MTRCIKQKVNLKSSTYNQTGQNSFEQLMAYNSMSIHLRQILSAKSVVDARNKNYLKKKQQCKVQETGDKRICPCPEVINDVIDRLAYDTVHHPMDILRMHLSPKRLDCCNYNLDGQQLRVCSGRTCYEENDQMSHRSTSKSRRTVSPAMYSPKRKKFMSSSVYGKELKDMRQVPHIIGPLTCYSQRRKCSQSLMQETNDQCSISSNVSQCCDYDGDDQSVESKFASKQLLFQREEEKKYVKFIYDITKEIIQRGLYTDKELQNVFKKHIDRYKGILNMNKMLYEIYQLKISLNMTEDSETDDELEDLIQAQKLLSVSEIRPPTPPKVLNENKVMEKLESYQKMNEKSRKTVTLVDANPELLVTERDVLISLVEVGIDPEQVQHICKNLRHKSRDTTQPIEIPTTNGNSSDLEIEENLEELRYNDASKRNSPKVESPRDSVSNNSPRSLKKQEANFSNLASTQEKKVETEKKIESENILENDKVDS